MTTIKPDTELDKAAQAFIDAGRAYREAVKRHAQKERGGVIWLSFGPGEMVCHSESGKYNQQIMKMIHDKLKDEFVFTEKEDEE